MHTWYVLGVISVKMCQGVVLLAFLHMELKLTQYDIYNYMHPTQQ